MSSSAWEPTIAPHDNHDVVTAPFPLTLRRQGDEHIVVPLGEHASAAVVSWLARGVDPPAGYRLLRGPAQARDLPAAERPIPVDQTNRSVIVAEQVVVKWVTGPVRAPHPAPERVRRLIAAGFTAMPPVWAFIEWQAPGGDWTPVVMVTGLIDSAADGWTWCLAEARAALGVAAGPAQPFAAQLGEITARMHRALADSPTGPVAVHGDFHVGQILRDGAGQLYVTDFDGNPTLSAAERMAHRPAAYDVAGMLMSLENVGHVLRHYHPQVAESEVIAWTEKVQGQFLAGYRTLAADLLDESLLEPYMDEQILRELAYADRHLPRWRYVPEAALRRRGRL